MVLSLERLNLIEPCYRENCRFRDCDSLNVKLQEASDFSDRGNSSPSQTGVYTLCHGFFFLILSALVDIIETKKFCEFEISTLFCFRVVAIRNMGGQR